MSELRVERRVGVTDKITASASRNLYALSHSETWPDLLDVLERCCIEIESALISVDVANRIAVLENHKLSKAAWVVFERMQERIVEAGNAYLSSVAPQPVVPSLTEEEQERDFLMNPTNYLDRRDEGLEN